MPLAVILCPLQKAQYLPPGASGADATRLVHQHALRQKPREEIADPTWIAPRVVLRPLVHGLQAGQLAEDKAGQVAGAPSHPRPGCSS